MIGFLEYQKLVSLFSSVEIGHSEVAGQGSEEEKEKDGGAKSLTDDIVSQSISTGFSRTWMNKPSFLSENVPK